MAEAIISRRGYTADGKPELRTEIITYNQNWTVPKHKGNISVRIFGAGATGNWQSTSGHYYGGSGWMNNAEFNNLTQGRIIKITIGQANTNVNGYAGGSTSFGTYLSANGGSGSDGGAGGACCGDGYQFGGGGGETNYNGGNGGMWGGGGGGSYSAYAGGGGNGGMYGGGGGGSTSRSQYTSSRGGDGGMYGGGGGCGVWMYCNWYKGFNPSGCAVSNGGEYGGNGGFIGTSGEITNNAQFNGMAKNGTNTLNNNSVPSNLRGMGLAGNRYFNITFIGRYNTVYKANFISADGGGGFGGNGGSSPISNNNLYFDESNTGMGWYISMGGSGGGGYGGRGANGDSLIYDQAGSPPASRIGGGGGGYGGNGESTGTLDFYTSGGGGGGYFSDGYRGGGGGYYNYCHGGGNFPYNTFSFGTGGCNNGMAMPGACIIQYYA